ncbi:hypothetical protein NDN01_11920 [Sphingomonas sp. QA11]|uniref:hypothetical protein n=1 Tax=Sphingomonas sp. QA11 TaxID=2950605 RepID=UPI002349A358|nr:hypothetical protein [Sphingomonas sp. QA11]WCM29539.1 hypothetical protein NDN01_11920 [Sphingomonas sp. QA11]
MTKTFLAAAAMLAAFSAPAFAKDSAPERRFTRDGQTYVYTMVAKTNRVVISGRRYPSGSAFELTVRGDQVSGISGGEPVSFSVKNAQAKLTPVALASR